MVALGNGFVVTLTAEEIASLLQATLTHQIVEEDIVQTSGEATLLIRHDGCVRVSEKRAEMCNGVDALLNGMKGTRIFVRGVMRLRGVEVILRPNDKTSVRPTWRERKRA